MKNINRSNNKSKITRKISTYQHILLGVNQEFKQKKKLKLQTILKICFFLVLVTSIDVYLYTYPGA